MEVKDCFNKNGDFRNYIDPYRCSKNNPIYSTLFSENGYALEIESVRRLINENKWKWYCDAVKYYYSSYFDSGCKGNYTAIYAWR